MSRQLHKVCCPHCGKQLNGVTLDYHWNWSCSECADDQTDVLHCERGSMVKAVNLDAGWPDNQGQAHELLTKGAIYEVENLQVGSCQSSVCLKEFPGRKFNTIHFERCGGGPRHDKEKGRDRQEDARPHYCGDSSRSCLIGG